MKLWGGRFGKDTDASVEALNASLSFDVRLFRQDVQGSLAHAKLLRKAGIFSEAEYLDVKQGLKDILRDFESGGIDPAACPDEDVHSLVERLLVERIGEAGLRLHTGRSRNDQVALDTRLWVREAIQEIRSAILALCRALVAGAEVHTGTILPGYTHLQRAQPVTLAHHWMAYFQMLSRDVERLEDCAKRVDAMPLGSGALAGTTYDLDRKTAAIELGFSSVTANSMDAVSDRDYVIELVSSLAVHMMHLSRFAEELVLWSSREFGFVEIDDAYATGSSIMPQKKNPDVAELVRGKTGRVYGDLVSLLTMMKALPLAYDKDMQEDKEALFDAVDTVLACLPPFTGMVSTLKVDAAAMRAAASDGFLNATDFADYLVRKGVPFRTAHEISGKVVRYCIERGSAIEALPLDVLRAFSDVVGEDVYPALSLEQVVAARRIQGGPAPESVADAIASANRFLAARL